MSYTSSKKIAAFRRDVWKYWRAHGRHDLPWRKTSDPYRILVSEIMLQQTQVPRVVEKYKAFIKAFPTVRALAKARLADVLKLWSGLGYNRRAKYLHDSAKILSQQRITPSNFNFTTVSLKLPGVGKYTGAAVRIFAWNEPDVLIETNIRTALIQHFFAREYKGLTFIKDAELEAVAREAAKGQDPRQWHWALMDYGAHLKRIGVRLNARSAHYTKQSKFEGSLRQVRGQILRDLYAGKQPKYKGRTFIKRALEGLERDGLIVKKGGGWRIA